MVNDKEISPLLQISLFSFLAAMLYNQMQRRQLAPNAYKRSMLFVACRFSFLSYGLNLKGRWLAVTVADSRLFEKPAGVV